MTSMFIGSLLNGSGKNESVGSIFPYGQTRGKLFRLPRRGKTYMVRLIENPGLILKESPMWKPNVVSTLLALTDLAMAKGSEGTSFGEKKIETFIPDDGWFAEIWDITEKRFVGFSSLSRKRCRLTLDDVEEVIRVQGTADERAGHQNGTLICSCDMERLRGGISFTCHFIESAMIDPRYQGNYFTTSVVESMMVEALVRNQNTPLEERLNLRLDGRGGQTPRVAGTTDQIYVATMAATVRTCVAMRPFHRLYPNAMFPCPIDWFEKTKRYVLAGRKHLGKGFLYKDRYRPGLNYPLDSNRKPLLPEKEKSEGKGGVWYEYLTRNGYTPSTDAVLLTGWMSFQGTNRVSRYVIRKVAATNWMKRILFLREWLRCTTRGRSKKPPETKVQTQIEQQNSQG